MKYKSKPSYLRKPSLVGYFIRSLRITPFNRMVCSLVIFKSQYFGGTTKICLYVRLLTLALFLDLIKDHM